MAKENLKKKSKWNYCPNVEKLFNTNLSKLIWKIMKEKFQIKQHVHACKLNKRM